MSIKRYLSHSEVNDIINSIIDELRIVKSLPMDLSKYIIKKTYDDLKIQLDSILIYPECIPILKEKLILKYRLVLPGKSVGIMCGQSIGEMQTQTTLNTFHSAGLSNKVVVQGVPRFLEIIDTNRSETQGTPSCYIYLKQEINRVADIRDIIGYSLICYHFHNLYVDHDIITDNKFEDWYIQEDIKIIKDKEYNICISYDINIFMLYKYKISLETIIEKLRIDGKIKDDMYLIPSPLFMGKIHIWIKSIDPRILHQTIMNIKICGINRIENIFFTKNKFNEWYIETDGSNLEEVLNLPYVDSYKTYSNDIWEIYTLFGIEAVYAYILEELENLMPTIDNAHLSLLANRMTVSGKLCSITRYTRKNENSSIFSKTTFEETLSGFLTSALHNEQDTITGASASIICGRVPNVGSGMNEIKWSLPF